MPIDLTTADLVGVSLVREQQTRVRDLAGFRRGHKVPTEHSERAVAFVARIAAADISEDLEQRFLDIRKHLKFRRIDVQVSEPEGGQAVIATPWFDYGIRATLTADDPESVCWQRTLSEFRQPKQLSNPALALVFGTTFDTVRLEPPEMPSVSDLIDQLEAGDPSAVTIDYDRQATWCHLTFSGVAGRIRICELGISLTTAQPKSAPQLIASFLQVRERFAGLGCVRL